MKEGQTLYNEIEYLIEELWNKLISKNYNNATQFTYEVALVYQLQKTYNKLNKSEKKKEKET